MRHNIFHITMSNIGKEAIHVGGPDFSRVSTPVYREHKPAGHPIVVLIEHDVPVNDTRQFWMNFSGRNDGTPDLGDLFVECQYSQGTQQVIDNCYSLRLFAMLERTPFGEDVHLEVNLKSQSTFELNCDETNIVYLEVSFYSAGLVYL